MSRFLAAVISAVFACSLPGALGMQVTGYDPEVHDRFASGFPASPANNPSPAFIGAAHNWAAVGWNSGNARAGYGFLSPRHHVLARHFKSGNARRVFGSDLVVHTRTHQSTVDIGFGVVFANETLGDLSLSTLASDFPESADLPRYPILDLNAGSSSNSPSSYNGRALLVYGHWGWNGSGGSPRIASAPIHSVVVSGNNHYFTTPRTLIQLEGNDSGSPVFALWNDIDGVSRLAIIGNHAAINETENIHNFMGTHQVMSGIASQMSGDGRVPWIAGEPARLWQGGSGQPAQRKNLFSNNNWSPNGSPVDRFVRFDGSTTSHPDIVVNSNGMIRGLAFHNAPAGADAFSFSGTSTLGIGRGGVMITDASPVEFEAPLRLDAHQFWDAGAGGVTVAGPLDTNGYLLEIRSPVASVIEGQISGSGGLALESGFLAIHGAATYSGTTWAHQGTLAVHGNIASSEAIVAGPSAVLRGTGVLPQVTGGGLIAPGPGRAVLTAAALEPGPATAFQFRFSQEGAPDYADASDVGNAVLRVTESPPLVGTLGAGNPVRILLDSAPTASGALYRGGFFLDDASAAASVEGADFEVWVADAGGPLEMDGMGYAPFAGDWTVSVVPETADFGAGPVDGLVLELDIEPDALTYGTWVLSKYPPGTPPEDLAPEADTNGDGMNNLTAYALGLDPTARNQGVFSFFEAALNENVIVVRFRRHVEASDVDLIVEAIDELNGPEWIPVTDEPVVIDPDLDGDGSVELVEQVVSFPPGDSRGFVRLRVVAELP